MAGATIVADARRAANIKDPHGVSEAHATLELAYFTLERRLSTRDHDGWVAGEAFTLADCAAAPALRYAAILHPRDRDTHPALAAYADRVRQRPAVARVIDQARPYRQLVPAALAEHLT